MISPTLFAEIDTHQLAQFVLNGLLTGMLLALIALGYTMVYGIVELINFAHGDLFMLGSFLAWTIVMAVKPEGGSALAFAVLFGCLILVPTFCASVNAFVDGLIYKPLRRAPKLAPLVSAIGVSFIFLNLGLFWGGSQDVNFPELISKKPIGIDLYGLQITPVDLLIIGVTIALMAALTVFIQFTTLGKAMRATAQNPVAAQLMGINTDRVITLTFAIGGALAGVGSIVFALKINTIHFAMGYTNGLYAFTAAVIGGIGNIPGAVLGGILIGLIRSLGSLYFGEQWTGALVFAVLIVVLVFRPQGLLGARVREKV